MAVQAETVGRFPDELESAVVAPLLCAGIMTFNAVQYPGVEPGELVV